MAEILPIRNNMKKKKNGQLEIASWRPHSNVKQHKQV